MNRFFISAIHKSSGKTTISIGLAAALAHRGHKVQTYKKGPDFIDPMWLHKASGQSCYNLDFYTQSREEIGSLVATHSQHADITLIEGNKGLYDGLDLDGSNSNAALAKLLDTPVVLVIDTRGMTRGVAPIILGHQAFDPDLKIRGVIFNNVGGSRHEQKLRSIVEHYTEIPVLGAIHRDQRLDIDERHLGLIPSNEAREASTKIENLRQAIERQVDIDQLIELSHSPALPFSKAELPAIADKSGDIRIGIIRDEAFGFYYDSDIEAFREHGARLIPIDSMNEAVLPEIDGLFIGGGFPESRMELLAANQSLKTAILNAINNGLPCYAECGGLMYLSRSLVWKDTASHMVGVIPADAVMYDKPQGRGYVKLSETTEHPWGKEGSVPEIISAHEFHYSRLENFSAKPRFAYTVKRGMGIDGAHDGIIYKNLLANYTHLRDTSRYHWVSRYLNFVRKNMKK
jgi:cobyrinic acid a,c-diamide synthase